MTPERRHRIEETIKHRQLNLAVILENVHDPHNVGAVLRSCDAVGIQEVYLLVTDPQIDVDRIFLSKRASSGARKWLDVFLYTNLEACITDVRLKYTKIYGTKLDSTSRSLYEHDLTGSLALAFGNEHDGLSEAFALHLDSNIEIPQYGMVKSLNISVACAVALYEALRQRNIKEAYDVSDEKSKERSQLLERYEQIQEQKIDQNFPVKR